MNTKNIWPFIALLALLFAWPVLDRMIAKKFFPDHLAQQARTAAAAASNKTAAAVAPQVDASADAVKTVETTLAPATTPAETTTQALFATQSEDEPASTAQEQTATLSNNRAEFSFTSRGAGLNAVVLKEYRRALDKDSGPMVLDFSAQPALSISGIPGLSVAHDFEITTAGDGSSIQFKRTTATGLRFERTVTAGEDYVLHVHDRIVNTSSETHTLSNTVIHTGPMTRESGHKERAGILPLGVDSLSPGGEKVQHWGKNLGKFFTQEMEKGEDEGVARALPLTIDTSPRPNAVDWVAAKNKYFVQILTPPENSGDHLIISARRAAAPRELADPTLAPRKMTEVTEVGAAIALAEVSLAPGQALDRESTLYVGPMKYDELKPLSLHRADVMEFGMWAPVGKFLLYVLNAIHDKLPPHNYGIAIILLTLIVRTIFWPITHKSTESMKRMSAVTPLVNEIRAKYKENPQKQQQEIMALYKEHKVNPLGGCLPMLIQIPVFIALFVVLRIAIELRFADFLWIKDLSEPENLFPGMLPFGLSLNILPLLMAFTMYLQMKLSPSAGDPAQQKIMAVMMPGMMLIFLYNFAAGLALYWTTQNALMIFQQIMMKKKATPITAPAKTR
ncbi:MAG: membrane protein insertase YidC [Kiritimatiellae bacterium]|nr:membrane protein insertase YidC [Kiritimatiellia bacterium]